MKRIILMTLCALFTFSIAFAQDAKKNNNRETVNFYVEDMDCENCKQKVEKNIAFERGVTDMKIDLSKRMVELTYRTDRTDEEKLVAAFKKLGYGAIALEDGAPVPVPGEKKDDHGHKH